MAHPLGIDLGFYFTKTTDLHREARFESVVAYQFDSMIDTFNASSLEFTDPKAALVGHDAIVYGHDYIRHKDDNWLSSDECRVLFQTALSEIVDASGEVFAVVSLPISLYKTKAGVLVNNLTGIHKFTRKGRDEQSITTRLLEIPQGYSSIIHEMLDDAGQPCHVDLAVKRLACVDIGSRNTNLILVESLRDIEYQSESFNFGCWTMIDTLRKLLAKRFQRASLSIDEAADALQSGVLENYGKEVSIKEEIARVKSALFASITTQIEALWPDIGSIAKIYISGGGALLLGDLLEKKYDQASTVKHPIFANAYGAAKYARRLSHES